MLLVELQVKIAHTCVRHIRRRYTIHYARGVQFLRCLGDGFKNGGFGLSHHNLSPSAAFSQQVENFPGVAIEAADDLALDMAFNFPCKNVNMLTY